VNRKLTIPVKIGRMMVQVTQSGSKGCYVLTKAVKV